MRFFGYIWVKAMFGVKIWFVWDEVFGRPILLRQFFFKIIWFKRDEVFSHKCTILCFGMKFKHLNMPKIESI